MQRSTIVHVCVAGGNAPGPEPHDSGIPYPLFSPSLFPSLLFLSLWVFLPSVSISVQTSGASLNMRRAPDGYRRWVQLAACALAKKIRRLQSAPPCSTFLTTSCCVRSFDPALRHGSAPASSVFIDISITVCQMLQLLGDQSHCWMLEMMIRDVWIVCSISLRKFPRQELVLLSHLLASYFCNTRATLQHGLLPSYEIKMVCKLLICA